MRSQIFLLLMLFTPGILGIPTPMETNDVDDESTELLITDDLLQVNESSVENTDISNGVSIECARACMHVQFICMQLTCNYYNFLLNMQWLCRLKFSN